MFHDLARDDVFRLETQRLWLRWPQAADAPALAALAGDWEVARMSAHLPHPYRLKTPTTLSAGAAMTMRGARRFA